MVPDQCAAVIVAAGQGLRTGLSVPKQFVKWRGKPLIRHSVETLIKAGCAPIVVVISAENEETARQSLSGIPNIRYVTGGTTRQESVRNGLVAIQNNTPRYVLIHDAARPHIPADVLSRLFAALSQYKAVIPALSIPDSVITTYGDTIAAPADRDQLRRVQTPQAFHFDAILNAHLGWSGPLTAGDDAQVALASGIEVALVEGDETLRKMTYAADFKAKPPLFRVGMGYDVHRFAPDTDLWLCGVKIDHAYGLSGHSDADVGIHALVDALLGALAQGDIGQHFPPSDPQWKGAASARFLEYATQLVTEQGYQIGNIDITLICEEPKLSPYKQAMCEKIAQIAGIEPGQVSVKATTTEKLGFTGRKEGIAAQAIVSLHGNAA